MFKILIAILKQYNNLQKVYSCICYYLLVYYYVYILRHFEERQISD